MRAQTTLVALLLVATLSTSGCAPIWYGLHQAEQPLGNGSYTEVTPLGEQQSRAVVETHPGDPAPDEVAPAKPEPVSPEPAPLPPMPPPPMPPPPMPPPPMPPPPMPPPPSPPPLPAPDDKLVGPPYGTHPLRFACVTQQRASRELAVQHWAIWDVGEKLVMGMIGLFEVLVAGLMVHSFSKEDQPIEDKILTLSAASVMGLDGLGLFALIALTRPTWQSQSWEQDGQWHWAGGSCPAGLRVVFAGRELPIDAAGQLDLNDEAWLVRELVLRDAPLELRCDQASAVVRVDPATRCAWAAGRRLPAPPYCGRQTDAAEPPANAILPLPAAPRDR